MVVGVLFFVGYCDFCLREFFLGFYSYLRFFVVEIWWEVEIVVIFNLGLVIFIVWVERV